MIEISSKKRTKQKLLRLSESEYSYLKKQADLCGMKTEPYMRQLIMGHEVHPLPPDSHIQLVRELSAIGNNINQLAKVANSTHRVPQGTWDAIQKSLDHLWGIYYGDN